MRLVLVLLAARADDLPFRHSRERGNPGPLVREPLKSPDPRVRGNDDQKPAGLMTRIRSPMRCPLREMEKGRRLFPPAFGLLRAGQAAAFAALRSLLLR
ncbi:hypothetical protein LG3211_1964 [Lysobacter gummosus]|nr:hypothetical protein LG3211_1964 [Lysobacter gummosus]